jgi:hypothetical protein
MSLDIGSGSGRPYLKYNAKAGRWYVRGDNGQDVEIPAPTCIIDCVNIATGWFLFRENQAPDRAIDRVVGTREAQPTPDHKRGFVVTCYSEKCFGGAVEMSSSSMHLCNAIADAYDQYSAAKEANPGRVPVFECTGTVPSKDKLGTNYKPTLQLLKWVDRPGDLPDEPAAQARAAAASRPAAPPSSVTAVADLGESEF